MADFISPKWTAWRGVLPVAALILLVGTAEAGAAPASPVGWTPYPPEDPPPTVPENQIRALVDRPSGAIAPGDSDEVTVVLENPEDSGRVVIALEHGGFYSSSSSYSGTDPVEDEPGVWQLYPPDIIKPFSACESGSCLEEGQLPLAPGESASLQFLTIDVPQDASTQVHFQLGRGHVSLITADAGNHERDRRRIELFLDHDIYRAISEAEGEAELPAPASLESEYAGHAMGDASVTLHYPPAFPAGRPFPVTATVTNTGDITLQNIQLEPGTRDPLASPRYQWLRECLHCWISGGPPLEPGESATLALGSYYPQDNVYSAGTLSVPPPQLQLSEPGHRMQTLFMDAPSLSVDLTGPETPQPRPGTALPERTPLDFGATGLRDPNTGNEWLPLALTEGFDAAALEAAMAAGDVPSSFRVASLTEVETLLLNHLHSQGLNLRRHDLYGEIDHDTIQALTEVKQWLAGTPGASEDLPARFFVGVVSDPAHLLYQQGVSWATDLLTESLGGFQPFLSPVGLRRLAIDQDDPAGFSQGSIGWWLVHSPEAPPPRPADRASFHDRLLVIPAVEESGQQYRAMLEMMDPVSGRLRVVSLEPLEETVQEAPRFDPATGTIGLPEARVFWPDGTETTHDTTLTLVPGSSPPVFHASGDF